MADITPITRERIAETETTIRPYVRRTPLVRLGGSDFGLSLHADLQAGNAAAFRFVQGARRVREPPAAQNA
jgi:hypothetical protein